MTEKIFCKGCGKKLPIISLNNVYRYCGERKWLCPQCQALKKQMEGVINEIDCKIIMFNANIDIPCVKNLVTEFREFKNALKGKEKEE